MVSHKKWISQYEDVEDEDDNDNDDGEGVTSRVILRVGGSFSEAGKSFAENHLLTSHTLEIYLLLWTYLLL